MKRYTESHNPFSKMPAQGMVSCARGLSLIEVSIALIVIGLIAAAFMALFDLQRTQNQRTDTLANMNTVKAAIENFYYANDRYPCPADPLLTEADGMYGVEDCGGGGVISYALPAGGATGLRGSVPFRTLSITAGDTLDYWANRLSYSVVTSQTDSATFAPTLLPDEGLRLLRVDSPAPNQCADTVSTVYQNGHFVIFSHGDNGAGAVSVTGQPTQACLGNAARDGENCTDNGVFFAMDCARALVEGADYYDDLLIDQQGVPSRIWFNTAANPQDAIGNAGRFGLNTPSPPLDVHVDVAGNILIEGGTLKTHNLCDENGTRCFQPARIGGSGMTCFGRAMTGIEYGDARCTIGYTLALPDICPSGQIVVGLQDNGSGTSEILCAAPPPP